MARPCPDLAALRTPKLEEFWKQNRPSELKYCSDRLLAESLPLYGERKAAFVLQPSQLLALREEAGLDREKVAAELGVTVELLTSWEEDRIRPPASLSLIYPRLREFNL
ncbi:MAG: helix-turn-helix domain-containing protein [Armatimonadetes bacterium]|nr:helix-turn-helix domain-containing protein [Armatimonadota bacterium]